MFCGCFHFCWMTVPTVQAHSYLGESQVEWAQRLPTSTPGLRSSSAPTGVGSGVKKFVSGESAPLVHSSVRLFLLDSSLERHLTGSNTLGSISFPLALHFFCCFWHQILLWRIKLA